MVSQVGCHKQLKNVSFQNTFMIRVECLSTVVIRWYLNSDFQGRQYLFFLSLYFKIAGGLCPTQRPSSISSMNPFPGPLISIRGVPKTYNRMALSIITRIANALVAIAAYCCDLFQRRSNYIRVIFKTNQHSAGTQILGLFNKINQLLADNDAFHRCKNI